MHENPHNSNFIQYSCFEMAWRILFLSPGTFGSLSAWEAGVKPDRYKSPEPEEAVVLGVHYKDSEEKQTKIMIIIFP